MLHLGTVTNFLLVHTAHVHSEQNVRHKNFPAAQNFASRKRLCYKSTPQHKTSPRCEILMHLISLVKQYMFETYWHLDCTWIRILKLFSNLDPDPSPYLDLDPSLFPHSYCTLSIWKKYKNIFLRLILSKHIFVNYAQKQWHKKLFLN